MTFKAPSGWTTESDKLYVHNTGVRIQRMTYHDKDGWYLIPLDLDTPVVEFEPTAEGRDKAFEAFANGALKMKPVKPKAEAKTRKAKAIVPPPEENEEGDEHPAEPKEAEVAAEEEDEDDDEDEEKEEEADEAD